MNLNWLRGQKIASARPADYQANRAHYAVDA
jgi:hypothetical protein